MIYTTPLHQYPTTVTLSPRRRQELIQIAEAAKIPILEDDYDHEFHYLSPPPTPLSCETPYGIYIASFSKILFPGCRLGVIACDENLRKQLTYQKFLVSRQTDAISQLALAQWMRDGGFERHLRKMRRIYEGRFHVMLEALSDLSERRKISWNTPTGGMSIWVNVQEDCRRVAARARDEGVFFQDESQVTLEKTRPTHLRIGFACVHEQEIKMGIQVLERSLRRK